MQLTKEELIGFMTLEDVPHSTASRIADELLAALRAQADARPVALRVRATPADKWVVVDADGRAQSFAKLGWETEPLYTHPEASAPGLSDDERQAIEHAIQRLDFHRAPEKFLDRLRAILTRASAATVGEASAGAAESWKKNAEDNAVQKQSLQDAILKAGRDYVRSFLMADEIPAFDAAMATADMRHGKAAQQQAEPTAADRKRFDETTERLLKEQTGFAAEVAKIGKHAEHDEEILRLHTEMAGLRQMMDRANARADGAVALSNALQDKLLNAKQAELGADEWAAHLGSLEIGSDGEYAFWPNREEIRRIKPAFGDPSETHRLYRAAQSGQRAGVDEDARDAVRMRFLIEGNHALISCICHDPVEHYEWSVTGIPCGWHRTQREAIDDAMGCAAPTQQQEGGK